MTIDGTTINTVPNVGSAEFEGGLLTSEATNIGTYADNSLAIIPEFRLGVGTQLTNNVSVRAGYNFIIWNAVARAGSQLPPGLEVDPRNLPPSPGRRWCGPRLCRHSGHPAHRARLRLRRSVRLLIAEGRPFDPMTVIGFT